MFSPVFPFILKSCREKRRSFHISFGCFGRKMAEREKFKVVVTEHTLSVPKLKELCHCYQNKSAGTMNRVELLREMNDADGILCLLRDKIDKEFLDNAPKLKVVSTVSVGLDHIDLHECKKRGVLVGNTPDVLTETTAELGALLILATAREMKKAMNVTLQQTVPVWSPYLHCSMGVQGSTIGIFGLGRIGEAVAKRMVPFKPNEIIYHSRKEKPFCPYRYVSFDELAETSDIIVVCVDAATCPSKIFNKEYFKKMKNTAVFVNISRGLVVDHNDLYDAMKSGEIAGAGLDVTDPEPLPVSHPLFSLNQCLILPHIGSATWKTREAMVNLSEQNLVNGLNRKGEFIGPVDFEQIS